MSPYNTPYHSASQCASSPVLCAPDSSPLACMARYSDADDANTEHLERARTCRQFPFASVASAGGSEWRLRCDAHNATRHRGGVGLARQVRPASCRVFRASRVPRHVARRRCMMRGALACGVGCLRQAASHTRLKLPAHYARAKFSDSSPIVNGVKIREKSALPTVNSWCWRSVAGTFAFFRIGVPFVGCGTNTHG